MNNKNIDSQQPLPNDIRKPSTVAGNNGKEFVFDNAMFDIETLSALQTISIVNTMSR